MLRGGSELCRRSFTHTELNHRQIRSCPDSFRFGYSQYYPRHHITHEGWQPLALVMESQGHRRPEALLCIRKTSTIIDYLIYVPKLFGKLMEWTNGAAYASFTDAIKEEEKLNVKR